MIDSYKLYIVFVNLGIDNLPVISSEQECIVYISVMCSAAGQLVITELYEVYIGILFL